jgi:DNA-binding NarL/FixJ family response regulator
MIRDLPIRILIADDHELLRGGVRGLLETRPTFRVVAEAGNAKEALHHIDDVDIVLMDIRGMNGIELTAHLRANFPNVFVLIYTDHQEEEFVLQAIKAGAHGYVMKRQPAADLIKAINKIAAGQTAFPSISKPELFLTLRERQVLWLIGDEKSNKDIARMLGIGTRAVEGYRSSIWQKLKARWPEERTRNLALLVTTAVKYQMRCSYPGSNFEDVK